MLDSNTFYLNQYEHNEMIREQQWENTMIEKQEAVVELAIKLIKREVDDELFNWVFAEYLDNEESDIDNFNFSLEMLICGDTSDYHLESDVIQCALDGSCKSLYDCELDEIVAYSAKGLTQQVLKGLK